MTNYDILLYNDYEMGKLLRDYCYCGLCPLKAKCGSDKNKCFETWVCDFKTTGIPGLTEYGMSLFLQSLFMCENCPVDNDGMCGPSVDLCEEKIREWLDEECSTCQESRQVGLEGLHPDDVRAVKEILEQASNDTVHHPNHYQLVDGIEVIDVIRVILNRSNFTGLQGYYLGNVLKYVLRADMKNGKEDYEKAEVYLDWLIRSMLEEKA